MAGVVQMHACAVLLGTKAVLIRGNSGFGKTTLALQLVASPAPFRFARLVGDDRINLLACNGQLIAKAPAPIRGLAEIRGAGIVEVPCEPMAALGLVVDICAEPGERLPQQTGFSAELAGVMLPRLAVTQFDPLAELKVKQALALIYRGEMLANGFCREAEPARA